MARLLRRPRPLARRRLLRRRLERCIHFFVMLDGHVEDFDDADVERKEPGLWHELEGYDFDNRFGRVSSWVVVLVLELSARLALR